MVPRQIDASIHAEALGKALAEKGLTLAVAESCTGGLLGAAVTSVAGSSAYFVGGVIAYRNDVKVRLLDVDGTALDEHGAVSPETALRMAIGVRKATGADIGVSVTGIAGPGGGSRTKPVGTVFIGVSASTGPDVPEASVVGEYHFAGTRESIRNQTVVAALTAVLNTL